MTDGTADDPAGRPIGRRVMLASLVATGAGIVFGARVQDGLQRLLLPLTLHDPTGLSDLLPVAGRFRIYAVTGNLPSRSTDAYSLRVEGLVARPTNLSYEDVHQRLPQTQVRRDFQCVTGWRVHDVAWAGVRLRDVLDPLGVQPGATHVVFSSFDGTYTETLTLDQARRDDVLVAHTLEGDPLSHDHGGPVRLIGGPTYGYKSPQRLLRLGEHGHPPHTGGYRGTTG